MSMTLRPAEEEQGALRQRARAEGASMQEAARRNLREYVARGQHRDRVMATAEQVITVHGMPWTVSGLGWLRPCSWN
jgi:hypothetical protein